MSASDSSRARRPLAALVSLALIACGDDPLRIRPAPLTGELAQFTILEPDRGVQAVQVQQPPGTTTSGVRATIDSGGVPLSSDTATVAHLIDPLCLDRYGSGSVPLEDQAWIMGCVTVPFRPRFGGTYRVRTEAAGRPTVSGTTSVPGDFHILARELAPVAGGMHVRGAWTRSAGAYRYVVMLDAVPSDRCVVPGRCERWIAVVADTAISVTLGNHLLGDSYPTYVFAVFAISRELHDYLTTGSTSGYFPVPPAQNVTGGHGAVGAWVRRGVVEVQGVDVQRLSSGIQLVHRGTEPVRLTVYDPRGPVRHCPQYSESCIDLAPGDSLVLPYARVQNAGENTEQVHVSACRALNPTDCDFFLLRY